MVMRRSMVWRVLTVLFIGVNLFGAVYAAWFGEMAHLAVHAVLLLLTVYFVWRFTARRGVNTY